MAAKDIGSAARDAAVEREPPPLSEAMERELETLVAVRTRRPRREWLSLCAGSLAYGALVLAAVGMRRDLAALPPLYVAAVAGLWLASFGIVLYWALVPAPAAVVPRARRAALAAGATAVFFVVLGLTPTAATALYDPSPAAFFARGWPCLLTGIAVAALPALWALVRLRGAAPHRRMALAAALGAGGAALAGGVLHLHCAIVERFHVSLVHGGLVALCALAALALAPRWLDIRAGRPDAA